MSSKDVLNKFYKNIVTQYPNISLTDKEWLKKELSGITLPDKPSIFYETFVGELHIEGCGTVEVTWNIGKLLQYVPKQGELVIFPEKELLKLLDFESGQVKETLQEIRNGEMSKQKKDYIVLAVLPGFPSLVIIDGNHRVLEHINDMDYLFKCLIIDDKRVLDYLEPNSRKFIEIIYKLNEIIGEGKHVK